MLHPHTVLSHSSACVHEERLEQLMTIWYEFMYIHRHPPTTMHASTNYYSCLHKRSHYCCYIPLGLASIVEANGGSLHCDSFSMKALHRLELSLKHPLQVFRGFLLYGNKVCCLVLEAHFLLLSHGLACRTPPRPRRVRTCTWIWESRRVFPRLGKAQAPHTTEHRLRGTWTAAQHRPVACRSYALVK